jgi:hypothetical protein
MDWAYLQDKHDQAKVDKYVKDTFGGEAGMEARYQELERLLEEQIAAVEAAFAEEMQAQEEKDEIARDSCLAPENEAANMVLRLGMAQDRAIDRKVRILLTMRKDHDRVRREATGPPADELPGAGADTPSSVCDSGQGSEAPPSLRETQTPNGGGLRQPANHGTESPAEENAAEIPKSPEQSENVIENKGPAAEGVRR